VSQRLVSPSDAGRAVAELVHRHVGEQPETITRLNVGDNWVWDVQLRNRSVIVKSGSGNPALEAWGLRMALGAGVRVPEVLAFGETDSFPYRYLVMSKLEGFPLPTIPVSGRRRLRQLSELGQQLRRLHRVETQGFGPPDLKHLRREGNFRGVAATWSSAVVEWMDRLLLRLDELEVLERGTSQKIRATLDAGSGTLEGWTKSTMLHGDLRPRNVLVDSKGKKVQGIIDFEGILLGDPAYDLAVLNFRERDELESILTGYRPDARFATNLEKRLAIYRLLRALLALRWGAAGRISEKSMKSRASDVERAHRELEAGDS
jgi:aminoglycoside phosphotransferase (APT) family kinase protein